MCPDHDETMHKDGGMTRWKVAGLIATVVIVLSFPLYHLKMERRFSATEEPGEALSATFVGSLRCKDCH